MPFKFNILTGNLDWVDPQLTTSSPLLYDSGTRQLTIQQAGSAQDGYLGAADWNTFNNKLDASRFNYITNPNAEIDTSGWNLYNNIGRTVPASVTTQDLTFTSTSPGNSGNGVNVDYIFHPSQSYLTPLVTVVSPTHITVAWYNGPAVSNNPTATQLKAAWDAVPAAVAIATVAITGTASDLQYITGSHLLANGGDTAPINGTGGSPTGISFIRSTIAPLQGDASFHFIKDSNNEEGQGVSTDFQIDSLDKGNDLQISFSYLGSADMVLGTSNSDITIWLYDITNDSFQTLLPTRFLTGPAGSIKTFVAKFTASPTSVNYRLIFHVSTQSTLAYDLEIDNVVVNSVLNPEAATQVPSVVLLSQPISGAVTDHMAVAFKDGASQWIPATSSYNGDYWGMFGFATWTDLVSDLFLDIINM